MYSSGFSRIYFSAEPSLFVQMLAHLSTFHQFEGFITEVRSWIPESNIEHPIKNIVENNIVSPTVFVALYV